MIATRKILERKYDEFNEMYFDDELPYDMILYPKSDLEQMGTFDELKFEWDDKLYPIIFINDQFNYTEDELNMLLLHEMVHAYLVPRGIELEEAHGEAFQELAHKIEKKSGYENIINGINFVNYRNKTFYIIVINENGNKDKHIATFTNKNIFKWYVDFFNNYKETCSINVDSFELYLSKCSCFDNFEITDEIINLGCITLDIEKYTNDILPHLTKITRIK